MKDNLNRKEITRCMGNDFEVYMEYRVDWVVKYGKMEQKHTFWAFSGDMYWYTLNMYRYSLGSGRFGPICTGTGQRCTGTCNALFSSFNHFLYFNHNLLIYDPI